MKFDTITVNDKVVDIKEFTDKALSIIKDYNSKFENFNKNESDYVYSMKSVIKMFDFYQYLKDLDSLAFDTSLFIHDCLLELEGKTNLIKDDKKLEQIIINMYENTSILIDLITSILNKDFYSKELY